jgi:hypothetical protein
MLAAMAKSDHLEALIEISHQRISALHRIGSARLAVARRKT